MSSSELWILETPEKLYFSAKLSTKYNLTIPHDELVKRVFVNIIKKEKVHVDLAQGF